MFFKEQNELIANDTELKNLLNQFQCEILSDSIAYHEKRIDLCIHSAVLSYDGEDDAYNAIVSLNKISFDLVFSDKSNNNNQFKVEITAKLWLLEKEIADDFYFAIDDAPFTIMKPESCEIIDVKVKHLK